MTRLIERWFPCAEVSENSRKGWGSGNTEKRLFTWFAARPLVQAKAAVICSLLPWPDDPSEQDKLQKLVRRAMKGYDTAHSEIVAELNKHYPDGASILDPFAGRAIIPHEATRLGIKSYGIEYSPVATLAGTLLADYPLRDWSQEPPLPFDDYQKDDVARATTPRLLYDVNYILDLIGKRYESEMDRFYPIVNGKRPWGYLWAITLPCVNCGRRFPFTGSYELRKPNHKKNDPGQSYYIKMGRLEGEYKVAVHEGSPKFVPTLIKTKGSKGRKAICLFCDHVHAHETHTRLMGDGKAQDALLLVADLDKKYGKSYRLPVGVEIEAIKDASNIINMESPFSPGLPAIPHEKALGSTGPRDYTRYGYHTYGDFCNTRQTLGFIKLSRIINEIGKDLLSVGISNSYVATLSGYAASVLARKICRSTRGGFLGVPEQSVSHIFKTGAPVPFGYDYFETGCGKGPGTWYSVAKTTISSLRKQIDRVSGVPAFIQQGTALTLPMPAYSLDAVVTDPPYEAMVEYSDASDLFYVWLKRSLVVSYPDFAITDNPVGVQDKTDEAVVKMTWNRSGDHRTPYHYYKSITQALREAKRVIKPGGVVTIMFGHDDPDVWKDFLEAISNAGLVLTGSWPARTEYGSQMNKGNIETTLTLVCSPAKRDRPVGKMMEVDKSVKQEIWDRIPLWQSAGLALQDQRMAAYGPAMEVVGRFCEIRDKSDNIVGLEKYLTKARLYVEEFAGITVGDYTLESFDQRTRFSISWIRMFGRNITSKSEDRWSRLCLDLGSDDTAGLLVEDGKGLRFAHANEIKNKEPMNSIIDIVFAVALAGKSISEIISILNITDSIEDDFLWVTMNELVKHLPNTDRDVEVWTWAIRNRNVIRGVSNRIEDIKRQEAKSKKDAGDQQVIAVGGDWQ